MKAKQLLIVSDLDAGENNLTVWKDLSRGFDVSIVNTDERAIEMANRQHFDMAVVDSTSFSIDVKKLVAVLPILQTEIEMVLFEGESVEELEHKVKTVFNRKNAEHVRRFLILDSFAPVMANSLPPFSDN